MSTFIRTYWKTLLWVSIITFGSLINKVPVHTPPVKIVGLDKLVHFVFYAMMSLLIYWDGYRLKSTKVNWVWVLILPIFYGGAIELVQGAMRGARSAEWADFVADALGSAVVFFLLIPLLRKKHVVRFKK